MWKNNCRFSDFHFFSNWGAFKGLSHNIFHNFKILFLLECQNLAGVWIENIFFHNFFLVFFLNWIFLFVCFKCCPVLLFCYYRVPVSSGLCTHWFIIVGLPLNTGVLVLIFLKINNKRALKHSLFQEKSNLGELHGLSTQKWGRERKGKIRSTLSFTNLDTVSSLKWGQNSKMAGFTAAAVWIFFFFLEKKHF